MNAKPTTFDECLAVMDDIQRAALEKLRKVIRAAAPNAVECVSYGLPAFKLDGKGLVALGGWKSHCALYPMSSATAAAFSDELKDFETDKGTIRFAPNKPLPATLVRKIVKARIAENAARAGKARPAVKGDPAVDAFLAALEHPRKPELEALRRLILGVSPNISEGIKWNSPSFRTSEWFATCNVHAKDKLRLILHLGAKARDTEGFELSDPGGLLQWLGKDRALVNIGDAKGLKENSGALKRILKEWIRHV